MIREDVVAIEETSFCEASTSSKNQVAISNTNDSVVRVLESSNSSSSSNEEEDDDGSRQLSQIRPQSHTDNGVKIFNRYSGCRNVSSTVNNTNVYKDGVTVNHNYCYCCPASIGSVYKSCVTRRGALFVIIVLLGISLLISLSVRISNLNSSKRMEYSEDETFLIAPTTRKLPKSTMFTTPKTTKISKTVHQAMTELNLTANPGWKIISRDEWGAALPNFDVGKLTVLPPTFVILSETETNGCTTTDKCIQIVRDIQASALENFMKPDLVYSFLVGGDGRVYEGRGWDVHAVGDYDTEYFDHMSISVSFIGTFKNAVPTETILQAAKTLLEFGVKTGKLAKDYKLKCLRQLSRTSENPSDKLYSAIKMWERWDDRNVEDFLSDYGS